MANVSRQEARGEVRQRWNRLVKPPGSLGEMEVWLERIAEIQESADPSVRPAQCLLFAGDHGITEEDVSAYPRAVTAEMVSVIDDGRAAINTFCETADVELRWRNVGSDAQIQNDGEHVRSGTRNFLHDAAMSEEECSRAIAVGRKTLAQSVTDGARIVALGEIGIGNTTVASAVTAELLDQKPPDLVGPGSGLDSEQQRHKVSVVEQGLRVHRPFNDAREVLESVGGFELAAHVGVILEALEQSVPVVLDGAITAASALVAVRLEPSTSELLLAGHRSPEPAHGAILRELSLDPLLELDMRLGEGTGAVAALHQLSLATAAFEGMATLDELELVNEGGGDS